MCAAASKGDFETARALHNEVMPLFHACFTGANPTPSKYALAQMGMMSADVRLPLSPLSEADQLVMIEALKGAGLSS